MYRFRKNSRREKPFLLMILITIGKVFFRNIYLARKELKIQI